MIPRGALAIFVKTPELSGVKTRLAAETGREEAIAFYRSCVRAIEAVAREASRRSPLDVYWAVAEESAPHEPCWQSFPAVWQGEGELGERLNHVYGRLLERHPFAMLAGADAPLLSVDLLREAAAEMNRGETPFVISPSSDGGYSLFGGSVSIPADVWKAVPYSTSETKVAFVQLLRRFGRIEVLPAVDDVDTLHDLTRLASRDFDAGLLPEQTHVVRHAQSLVARLSGLG